MADVVVAVTGGVASGKSECTRAFAALGIAVADADVAARAVVAPGEPALAAIADRFGRDVLAADGSLDRAAMRRRVFADDDARRDLEALLHPPIRRWLQAACAAAAGPYVLVAIPLLAEGRGGARRRGSPGDDARRDLGALLHPPIRRWLQAACAAAAGPYVVVAIPLLAEGGGRAAYPWLARIVVVDVPEAVQQARLMQRDGVDAALARRMIAAQATRRQRLAIADDVIVNDGPIEHLHACVARLDARYRR